MSKRINETVDFIQEQLSEKPKVGIILGSFVAGLIGYLILYFTGKNTSNINTK